MTTWIRYRDPHPDPPRSGPGLMTIPQVVWDAVAEDMRTGDFPEGSEPTLAKWLAMQYHYGGHEILYRETPEGVMVYAIGWEDVARYVDQIPPNERHLYESREVDPWPVDQPQEPKSP